MYLDPGLGSLIIQALIGLAVSVPVFVGIYWRRLQKLFRHSKKE